MPQGTEGAELRPGEPGGGLLCLGFLVVCRVVVGGGVGHGSGSGGLGGHGGGEEAVVGDNGLRVAVLARLLDEGRISGFASRCLFYVDGGGGSTGECW